MIKDRTNTLATRFVEVALAAQTRADFWLEALRCLEREVGFDLGAVVSSDCPGLANTGCTLFTEQVLQRWMSEFYPDELRGLSSDHAVDVLDILPTQRLEQLAAGREFILPNRFSSLAVRSWLDRGGLSSFFFARNSRATGFTANELALLDEIFPVLSVAHGLLTPANPPQSWGTTAQEERIAGLASRGLSNTEIAALVGCSKFTVRNHLVRVFRKANVSNRSELAFIWSSRQEAQSRDATFSASPERIRAALLRACARLR